MGLYSLARKVSGFADSAIGIGKKISGVAGTIGKKVSSIAAPLAAGAAMIGLEPVAAGLGAVAGLGAAVGKGADMIGGGLDKAEAVSGAVRSGIERVDKASKTYKKIKGVIRR